VGTVEVEKEYNNLARKCMRLLKNLLTIGRFSNQGNIEERKRKYIEVSNYDIPEQILKTKPKLEKRYWEKIKQRFEIKNKEHVNLTTDEEKYAKSTGLKKSFWYEIEYWVPVNSIQWKKQLKKQFNALQIIKNNIQMTNSTFG
jgi:hypothetical protein